MENKINRIKKELKDHEALIIKSGKILNIDWKGSRLVSDMNYLRYIIYGEYVYVSGYYGDMVLQMEEKTGIKSLSELEFEYFISRITTKQNEIYDFNSRVAIKTIKQKMESQKNNLTNIERDFLEKLLNEANWCESIEEWKMKINVLKGKYQIDLMFSWLYECGNYYREELYYIWYSLKMIYKQLLTDEEINKIFLSKGIYYDSSLYNIVQDKV